MSYCNCCCLRETEYSPNKYTFILRYIGGDILSRQAAKNCSTMKTMTGVDVSLYLLPMVLYTCIMNRILRKLS